MTPQDLLKQWPIAVIATLVGGGTGLGGSMVFANGAPTRTEVKTMIEDSRPIIELQRDVEHLVKEQEQAAKENKADHKEIMDVLKAIRRAR